VLLHVVNGWIDSLECFRLDGRHPSGLPSRAAFEVFS
jgi:hypothetical protein